MQLLRGGAVQSAADLAATNPRALRFVVRRLWDEDRGISRRSAEALAMAAQANPTSGRELIRRFLWALNDESGTNAGPVLVALAELAERSPELLRPYVGSIIPLLPDDGLSSGVVEVVERFVRALPEAADDIRDDVRALLDGLPAHSATRLRAALGLEVE